MSSGSVDLGANTGHSSVGEVTSLNGLVGDIVLAAGTNITLGTVGNTVTINAAGGAAITSINTDTTAAQTITVGTSGTDFAIANPGSGSHILNLPTASASNRGALSSADWSTFNNKGSGSVTSVGLTDSTNLFNVTNTPVSTSGTLTLASYKNQSTNAIFAGPSSGAAAAPTFRALTYADLPRLNPASANTVFEIFDEMFLYSTASAVGPFEMFYTPSGNATFSRVAPTNTNQIGIIGFNTGTVNTGEAVATSSIVTVLLGGITLTHSTYAQLAGVGVPTATNNYIVKFGLINTFPGAQNGVYFTFDRSLSTTNWQAVTVAASTSTVTDTGIAADTGWHSYRIEINQAATSVDFYIDGTKVATNTTHIPTTAGQEIGPMTQVQCNSATMAIQGTLNVDWTYLKYQLGSNRGTY